MESKKLFMRAIDRPHLLIFAEKIRLKSGESIKGLQTSTRELNKLQFSLANHSDEEKLQELICFFTEALERLKTIAEGINMGKIIHLDDAPKKGG